MADERKPSPAQVLSTPDTNTENTWTRTNTFLGSLIANALRLPIGAVAGKVWTCRNAGGNGDWSDKAPAERVALTGQTISQTATVIAAASGEYLATVYLECTTAGGAGTLDATFTYTDDVGLVTTASLGTLVLTGTGRLAATTVLRCSGGGIDYTLTVAGAVGGPVYSAYISLVRVG
jgi:hypothetical protein